MKGLIITGASGFVGTNLVKFLGERKLGVVHSLSLRQPLPPSLPTAQSIIHLAGKAHDLEKTGNDQEYFEVNDLKTRELFDLFLKSETRDFIYFSSVKAAADTVTGELDESVVPQPKTPYGQSKLQAEQYILSKRLPEGKRVFILRPCMIHGPGNKGNLNLLYKVVEKGIPYPLGAFDNRRSFLSVDNLLFILQRLLQDQTVQGGIYNLADDHALSTTELIQVIAAGSGRKAKIWNLTPGIIHSLAKIGDKLRLPLNSERLKKLTESYVVSNTKIKGALKIMELPTSTKEGLHKTIQSFRSN